MKLWMVRAARDGLLAADFKEKSLVAVGWRTKHSGCAEYFMTQQKIQVMAAVITRAGQFLLCERPAHKRHGGLWEFPGGKVEPGETQFSAVQRELYEELGVDVVAVGDVEFSIADPGSEFVIQFLRVTIAGEPQCLEHASLAWVSPTELLDFPLAPSDRHYAMYLIDRPGATSSSRT
jgi:mutator protein MutT